MKRVILLVVAVAAIMFTSCKKEYTITVQSNNESWGSVVGSGTYAKGTVISIGAISNNGYKFVKWQDDNTDNPRSITVEKNATYTAVFVEEGGGGGEEPTSTGIFSVSETQKVNFSPGNLQWSTTGSHAVAGGEIVAGTWRFAPNQWDVIAADNRHISSTYTGWIDLFGWATSGYDNKYPYMTSTIETDYGNGKSDISNTNYDWGVYNTIYNPKTNTLDVPGTWRTLTKDEWTHLLKTRATPSGIRYAKATVNGVQGLIIVPDNWSSSIYTLDSANYYNATFESNLVNATHWANMEAAGCVFLPAAGYRQKTSVYNVTLVGNYWSSTSYGSDYACILRINLDDLEPAGHYYRSNGISVRLVKEVE